MAEKATLLSKPPPVAQKASETSSPQSKAEGSVKSQSREASGETKGKADMSQQRESTKQSASESYAKAPKDSQSAKAVKTSGGEGAAEPVETQAVAGQAEADAGASISFLQVATYASFVLTFILAGFAAVVLFRKAAKIAERRFITSAKVLAGTLGVTAFHGFFATFLYTNYLRAESAEAPLSLTVAVWVLLGIASGIILNHLLTPKEKPEIGGVLTDAVSCSMVFLCVMFSFSSAITTNAAIILSLLGGLLYIIPVARSFSGMRVAMARHPELKRTPERALLHSILWIPAAVPVVGFLHICGALGPDLTLFLVNFLVFDFILFVGFAMIASAEDMGEASQAAEAAEADATSRVGEPAPEAPAPSTEPLSSKPKQPEPVVEFAASKPPRPAAGGGLKPPGKLPPRKPARSADSKPAAPAKPRRDGDEPTHKAPNTPPVRVKAPAKPKKRF